MSNIGEAQITRLTRERLAAIKKFLPVRNSFRDNLQAKQQAKMGFTSDTKQLFEPITTATMEVGEQTQEYLKTLPKDIVEAQFTKMPDIPPPPPDTLPPPVQPEVQQETKKSVPFIEKFTDEAIQQIREFKLNRLDDYAYFGDYAIQSYYHSRNNFLKDEYKKDVIK